MQLNQAFIRDNPWWADPTAIGRDPDLVRFRTAGVRLDLSIPFRTDVDAVYTIRGPRQVGKSTLLKRLAAMLIEEGQAPPRTLLYADIEGAGIGTVTRLRNALTGYLAWARSLHPDSRLYLLLDEMTGVSDWGTVVRALYREGLLANVTMIATGSHALDMKRGAEVAPGRRGEQAIGSPDWILMPYGFRDYIRAHTPSLSTLPVIDVSVPADAYRAALEIQLHADSIRALLDRYLMTGGFPHAVAAEQDTGLVAPGVYEIYRTAVISQIKRAGYREGPFREVITWAAAGRLGQEFSWNSLASETEVGAKDTARRYIEDAEQLFLWHVLQRSQNAATLRPALKSPKKLYPVDPFTWHMLSSWVDGDSDPWSTSLLRLADPTARGGLVEGVVADHLIRGYAPFAFYHRTTGGEEEIDLVVERAKAPGRIEIKYRRRVTRVHENHLAKYGGGLVITPDDLAYDATRAVARIPLYALLAGYADPITLYPSRG